MRIVTIIGNGRTRTFAPEAKFGGERVIWTMNDHAMLWGKRTDAVFELHDDVLETPRYSQEYKDWLKAEEGPQIWMFTPHPAIPRSVRYPLTKIANEFGQHLLKGADKVEDFYTSTIPYMIALALWCGAYERIELYGVELDKREEWVDQRDSVFFWIGKATALGVDVWIPEQSVLYERSIYPVNFKAMRPSLKPIVRAT